MAFHVGGNDVANSFGTSVGAGALTMKQALLVAAVFEASGAVIARGDVTETIRSGIVDLSKVAVFRALQNWVPVVARGGAMIISAMLLFKGFKHMNLGLSTMNNYFIVGMIGAAVWMVTFIFAKTLRGESLQRSTFLMFSWTQVFTASGFAFSHGSNDIANAIGPFAVMLDVLRTNAIEGSAAVPAAAMLAFGAALIAGLWFIGRRLPVSSTHILIGAVLGVGMVNRSTNWA